MRVAIVGCGPAGLLSAYACEQRGHQVVIMSGPKKKSVLGGAQYLHKSIPGLTGDPNAEILIVQMGHADGYAQKVYGNVNQPTSWLDFPAGNYDVWNLRSLYDDLYDYYEDRVVEVPPVNYADVLQITERHDLVFSSVPMQAICKNNDHLFIRQDVWIAYDHGDETGLPYMGDDTIVYNGLPDYDWYRTSRLFGISSTEFPHEVNGLMKVSKPLRHSCNCFDLRGNLQFIGRYGRWEKGVLVDHAYTDTIKRLDFYEV